MRLRKAGDTINIVAHPLSRALNVGAMVVLAAMMFLTATDVFLRYIFNSPIPGAYEIVEFMMGIIIPFALVSTASQRAHIGVDLVTGLLPRRLRKVIAIITTIMTFLIVIVITVESFYFIFEEYESNLTSSVLLIPVWPFLILFFLAWAILSLVFLVEAVQRLSEMNAKWTRS